jgi:hypothetical protein
MKIEESKPAVLDFGKDPDYTERDVAFLEIDPGIVDRVFGKVPIPLSRIHPCGAGQENSWTLVCGFPSQQIGHELIAEQRIDLRKFTAQCWGNKTLTPSNGHILPKSHRPPDESLDVFIPCPQTTKSHHLDCNQLIDPPILPG